MGRRVFRPQHISQLSNTTKLYGRIQRLCGRERDRRNAGYRYRVDRRLLRLH
ncbi:hypothetical protein BN903_18 [Halorubrum sp. AJ67]|nr:hypothetical protein BN903_18 [Halorubrum sp. AJ67]